MYTSYEFFHVTFRNTRIYLANKEHLTYYKQVKKRGNK